MVACVPVDVPADAAPLGAAGNALDSDMTGDLRRMIARTHTELEALNGRLLPQP